MRVVLISIKLSKYLNTTRHAKHFLQRTSEKAYIRWVSKDWYSKNHRYTISSRNSLLIELVGFGSINIYFIKLKNCEKYLPLN